MTAIKESKVDVLIVGAGPAGLMAATWMSRMGIQTRIVDKRNTKIFTGQADGVQTRTLEVLQTFGIAEKILAEANPMNEVTFWHPTADGKSLKRTSRNPNSTPGISRYHQVTLHQGRIERFYLDALHERGYKVERGVLPTSLTIDPALVDDHTKHAIKVTLRFLTEEESAPPAHLGGDGKSGLFRSNLLANDVEAWERERLAANEHNAEEEIVHCRYVLGCDGAASWVRKQLGYRLEGESRNSFWGVIDGVPVTDFPDIRSHAVFHAINGASMQTIPRENGLVRHYIQLKDLDSKESPVDRKSVTSDFLLKAAQDIFHPFKLDIPEIAWYTCYEVGQRICPTFDKANRVFISGDACHTHSPKAGQGMNVSMMDAYNLGWKVGLVAKGIAKPEILATYQIERHEVAQNLIDFDKAFSAMYTGQLTTDILKSLNVADHSEIYGKGLQFMSGTAANYPESPVVAKSADLPSNEALAKNCTVGKRFKSEQLVLASDARSRHWGDFAVSDGRWRIIAFPGDIEASPAHKQALFKFGDNLVTANGLIHTYTRPEEDLNAIIQVFAILTTPRVQLDLLSFPDVFRPLYSVHKYRDYWQIYTDEQSYYHGHGHAYDAWGISPDQPTVLVLRPDGHIACITELDSTVHSRLESFFSRNLLPAVNRKQYQPVDS